MTFPRPYYTHQPPPKTRPASLKPDPPPISTLPPEITRTAAHLARRDAKKGRKP